MKKHRMYLSVEIFFLLLFFSFHLKAAVYTYNATIDVSTPTYISHSPGVWEYTWLFTGGPTFTVQAGDTLQGTISFARNLSLRFLGPVNLADVELTFIDAANVGQLNTVSTTTLNGVSGPLAGPNPQDASSSGGGELLVAGLAETPTPTQVSFNGFSYSSTVVTGSGNFTPDAIYAYTQNDVPGAISVAPEPSVAGLMGIALIVLSGNAVKWRGCVKTS